MTDDDWKLVREVFPETYWSGGGTFISVREDELLAVARELLELRQVKTMWDDEVYIPVE